MKICLVSRGLIPSLKLRRQLRRSGKLNKLFRNSWFRSADFSHLRKIMHCTLGKVGTADLFVGVGLDLSCSAQTELAGRPYFSYESIGPDMHAIDVHYQFRQRITEFYQIRLKERVKADASIAQKS